MKKIKTKVLIASLLIPLINLMAVNPEDSVKYVNWQNKDPKLDKTMGVSVEKAYNELLQGKESKTVLVAVIDGGIDVDHEDLKDVIWVNEDEIPGNGIDDDNNGYIDDIHGWNFIGNDQGENIHHATLEVTRLYRKYQQEFPGWSEDSIKNHGGIDYDYYLNVKNTFENERLRAEMGVANFKKTVSDFYRYDSIVKALVGKDDYTVKELKKLKVEKKSVQDSARRMMAMIKMRGLGESDLAEYMEYFEGRLNYHYNTEFMAREVIGDDEYKWNTEPYGNNDIEGEDPSHGTGVSGFIGAVRNNGIGIDGIADNVKIMGIRTVPDGDEWDKDVANAIKYAIDNGAEIINMSFGKSFSPQKEFVDKIVKMADENDVLLVHAAGNDGKNIDIEDNFPNKFDAENKVLANNWMTIGASAYTTKKKKLVAGFSNYGIAHVDVFAPGHDMICLAPESTYDIASGTSFAAPVVSGVAALVKSYYPNLTAAQLKEIIMESSLKKDYTVTLPGTRGKEAEKVKFSTLSVSGGLVNVYEALKLAEEKSK